MSLQNFVPCQLWQAYFLGSLSRRFPQCEQVTWTSSTSVAVAYCCCCCCCSCWCCCFSSPHPPHSWYCCCCQQIFENEQNLWAPFFTLCATGVWSLLCRFLITEWFCITASFIHERRLNEAVIILSIVLYCAIMRMFPVIKLSIRRVQVWSWKIKHRLFLSYSRHTE